MSHQSVLSRRELLSRMGSGLGFLALADLLAAGEPARAAQPHAGRPPHHPARAKRIIFLYMPGGPSHVDLLDPKPRLATDNGKPLPFEKPKLERTKTGNLFASPWKFSPRGDSGIEVSELLPGLASRPTSTMSASSARWWPTTSITPAQRCTCVPASRPSHGPAWDRGFCMDWVP